MSDAALLAAESLGLELIEYPDIGFVAVDGERDAVKVRYWLRTHAGHPEPRDRVGVSFVDAEVFAVARTNPKAARELVAREIERGMEAYLREVKR